MGVIIYPVCVVPEGYSERASNVPPYLTICQEDWVVEAIYSSVRQKLPIYSVKMNKKYQMENSTN